MPRKKTQLDEENVVATETEPAETKANESKAATSADSKSGLTKIERASETLSDRAKVLADARARESERLARQNSNSRILGDWMSLRTSMRRSEILRGRIASIQTNSLPNSDERSSVFATIIFDDVLSIKIPFEEIYRDYPIDMRTVSLETREGKRDFARRQMSMAEKLHDLEIPFVITTMAVEGQAVNDGIIIGSRRKALEILERINYEPDKNGRVSVNVGDTVQAQVISVSEHSVQVNISGVDTTIQANRLSFRYIPSGNEIKQYYYGGQTLPVVVKEIKVREDGKHTIVASALEAELESAKLMQGKLAREGDRATGVITRIVESKKNPGQITIFLFLNAFSFPAYATSYPPTMLGKRPNIGDTVRVQIESFKDNGLTKVNILGTQGSPGLFRR